MKLDQSCPGSCPDADTLDLWRRGKLDQRRASEIANHLQRCQAARHRLMALPATGRGAIWWAGWGGVAAAAGLALLLWLPSHAPIGQHQPAHFSPLRGNVTTVMSDGDAAPDLGHSRHMTIAASGRVSLAVSGDLDGQIGVFEVGADQQLRRLKARAEAKPHVPTPFIKVDFDVAQIAGEAVTAAQVVIAVAESADQLKDLEGAKLDTLQDVDRWARDRWLSVDLEIMR